MPMRGTMEPAGARVRQTIRGEELHLNRGTRIDMGAMLCLLGIEKTDDFATITGLYGHLHLNAVVAA